MVNVFVSQLTVEQFRALEPGLSQVRECHQGTKWYKSGHILTDEVDIVLFSVNYSKEVKVYEGSTDNFAP